MGNPDDAAASAPQATWHIVFWILACLSISCMSQPRKRFCLVAGRYRIYYVSSPILCATDTVFILVRLISAMCWLRVDIYTASRFALDPRVESEDARRAARQEAGQANHGSEDEVKTEISSWPRVILFIIGTLPCAIKLIAIGGIPWTKALGMMFVTNFVCTELTYFLSSINVPQQGLPAAQSREQDMPQIQSQQIQLARLRSRLDLPDNLLFICAYLVHVGLVIFAVSVVWAEGIESLWGAPMAESVNSVVTCLKIAVVMILLLYIGFAAIFYLIKRLSKDKLLHRWHSFIWGLMFSSVLIPSELIPVEENPTKKRDSSSYIPPSWIEIVNSVWNSPQAKNVNNLFNWLRFATITSILPGILCLAVLFFMGRLSKLQSWRILVKIFAFWAYLPSTLIPKLPIGEICHRQEGESSCIPPMSVQFDKILYHTLGCIYFSSILVAFFYVFLTISRHWPKVAQTLLIEQAKHYNETEVGETDSRRAYETITNLFASAALCFFIGNVAACALWYAFKYDPAGTTNPSWTDVFG